MSQIRLVKVRVQPVVMLDDGETLQELEHPVMEIPAGEWESYSGERFPREMREWEERLSAERDASSG